MITCHAKGLLEESGIISCEILKESSCNNPLSYHLCSALGHHPLDEFDEVVLHLRLAHLSGDFEENLTELHISAHVADGIVEAICWDLLLRSHECVELCPFGKRRIDETTAIEGIKDG